MASQALRQRVAPLIARLAAVRFEVGAVDHQLLGDTSLCSQGREDARQDAHPAPTDEAVVDRGVVHFSHQSVADDV
jgi:hypothetical protein